MALEGTLKDFSLADIFQLIGLQRKTGVLTLKGKDDIVTVSFLDGKVVSADSLQRRVENRLGSVLVKTSRIETEQLEKALQIQKQTLQRLGTILVQSGMVEQEELREALQVQVLQTIYRLFRWKDGDYKFSQETNIEYDRDYVTPIAAESILMEGARMIDEWPIIERKIRSYELVFRKTPIRQTVEVAEDEDDADDVDFDFGDEKPAPKASAKGLPGAIKISRGEAFVYDILDGKRNVGDIVERSRYHEFDTVKAIYELLGRGLIEEVKETDIPLGSSTGTFSAYEEPAASLAGPMTLFGLAALLILSLIGMSFNPANIALRSEQSKRIQYILRRSISIGRLERIAAATETYMLVKGAYPLNLNQLVDLGLIDPQETVDPWGEKYKFQNQNDKVYIDGRPPGVVGRTDFRLFFTKAIRRSREMPGKTGKSSEGRSLILVD